MRNLIVMVALGACAAPTSEDASALTACAGTVVGNAAHANGTGFAAIKASCGAPDLAALADLDGDGRADLAWYERWNHGAITAALAR